jgi:hypothetical protein
MPELASVATADEIGGLFFINSYMMTFDAYSTLESSPWTVYSFGADPIKIAAAKRYLRHAVANSLLVAVIGVWISKSRRAWWGLAAAILANCYLIFLYLNAMRRGAGAGHEGWVQ